MAWTDANPPVELGEHHLAKLSNAASKSIFGDDLIEVYASDIHDIIAELRRHRAMVKRLEELATELERSSRKGPPGYQLATELRNRMKGE